MVDDDAAGFPPSASNTTVLAVNATSASAETDLSAATAVDTTTVPHAKLAASAARVGVDHELLFSSDQNGRLSLGATGMASPGTTGGQAIMANVVYGIPVSTTRRFFRFYNAGSSAANTAWTNPSVA